jgi:hypothetical protein
VICCAGPSGCTVWVAGLCRANLASLGFWHFPLAKIVLLLFMASAILMMALYSNFCSEEILELGYVL